MNFWKNLHPLLRRDKDNKYGSANYAVLSSLADSLSDAERDAMQKKVQLTLGTATGSYLDEWGSWFSVTRRDGETDDDYRKRIMWYLTVPRSTIEGIITGIRYYLDDSDARISIYEPWKNIFYLNKSKVNGDDHLQGFYYRYAVIDVSIDRPMSKAIYDAIAAFKPAGVKFYTTFNPNINAKVHKLTIAELKARKLFTMEKAYGFMYDHKLPVTFSDRPATLVNNTNYLKLNDSKLNGEDVLAGSPTHNVTYWNPLRLSYSPYKDVPVNMLMSSSEFYSHWSFPSLSTIVDGYDGHKAIHSDATDLTSGASIYVQQPIYDDNVRLIKPGEWYTISFYAKGTGFIRTHMYPSVVDSGAGQYVDGVFHGGWVPGDGMHDWTLTDEYIHHSWSFKTKAPLSPATNNGNMLFRTLAGNSTYVSLPKLEQGISATPWSPNPADPEYFVLTPTQRAIISSPSNTYVPLISSTTSMITGTLSVYNQFIANYGSLLSTYSGDTEYDRVRSLVNDPNTTVFLMVNADVPLTINGVLYPAGLSSVPVDKGSLNYTGSDINIPVSVTGTQDARIYYAYAKVKASKDIPGLGVNIKANQNVSVIKKGPVVGNAVVGAAVVGQETIISNTK